MALSEYMPYGAPELLDGARARMARSTLVAVLVVVLLVSALGAILSRSTTAIEPAPSIDIRELLPGVLPPPALERPATPIAPPSHAADPRALPVPIPDLQLPRVPDVPLPDDAGESTGPPSAVRLPSQAGAGRDDAGGEPPGIHDYVYYDVAPNLVKSVEPVYPDFARDAGVQGVVRVLMLIGLSGRVEQAVVAPGGSVPMLDEAALAAARACVFTPALSNEHPVRVWVSRSYRFSLH